MKKKSLIMLLIAVLFIGVAFYFARKEAEEDLYWKSVEEEDQRETASENIEEVEGNHEGGTTKTE